MKTKKFISVLTLIVFSLGMILSLGFLCGKNLSAQAAGDIAQIAESDEKVSGWLLKQNEDNIEAVKTDVAAGGASGYGKFELNKKNVELTARTNAGFKLVGWNVTYSTTELGEGGNEQNKEVNIFLHNTENLPTTTHTIESEQFGGEPVTLTLDYLDSNLDGYFDVGSFRISNIFSNMTVDPVFDYIYFNVEITDIFNLMNLNKLNSFSDPQKTIYYANSEFDGGVYTYHEAYYKVDNKVYYFDTIYGEDNMLYTKRELDSGEQKIDITRGAFRLGEVVNCNLQVDARSYNDPNSVNVDVLNVQLVENGVATILQEDETQTCYAKIYRERNNFYPAGSGRTTAIEFGVTINLTNNQTQTIALEYHKLYVATINLKVDGETIGNEYIENSITEILNSLTLSYYFSRININAYFVKAASDNENNQTFELYCNPYLYGESINYLYYIFKSLGVGGNVNNPKVTDNLLRYANIIDNFAIDIEYSSAKYQINFEPYVKIGENSLLKITDNNFKTDSTITNIIRGTSVTCGQSGITQNVGYKFFGYALTNEKFEKNSTLDLVIDKTRPQNITVLAIYEYAEYSLSFANYDKIKLEHSGEIYPINNLTLSLNDFEVYNFSSENLRAGTVEHDAKTLNLSQFSDENHTFKIGDKLTLKPKLNEGFNNLNFYISSFGGGNAAEQNAAEFSFVIDEQFLTNVFDENNRFSNQTIKINVDETFTEYSFSYSIDSVYYSSLDKEIVMADISLTTANDAAQTSYEYFNETDTESKPVTKITVTKLKLYDVVNISAKTRKFVLDGRTYEFNFVRFTADNKTSLNSQQDGENYTYAATINKDNIAIKVVYAAQTSIVTVVTNEANAFATDVLNDYLLLSQEGILNLTQNNQVVLNVGTLNLQFKNGDNPFNFGFALKNYRLVNSASAKEQLVDATNLESPYIAQFNIEGEQNYILEINFDVVTFRLYVSQYGKSFSEVGKTKTYTGEKVNFASGEYAILTYNNNYNLNFALPEGAYVNKFYFVNSGENIEADYFAQYGATGGEFNYNFTVDEIKNFFLTNGVSENKNVYTINVRVDYALLTFDINVEYRFLVSKGDKDNLLTYPNLNISYLLDEQNYSYELLGEKIVTFAGLPYGVSPTISLTSALPLGYISVYNWGYSNTKSDYSMGRVNGFSSINLKKLVAQENLIYSVEYQAFSVRLIIDDSNLLDSSAGSPEVSKNSVELFDSLQITMNANKSLGYKFGQMYYFSNYTLGEAAWRDFRSQVYLFNGSKFVPNDDLTYSADKTYYIKNVYNDSYIYLDENVNFDRYAIVNNSIYFYIVYDYIDITIVNLSEDLFAAGEYETTLELLNILPADYADYYVYKLVENEWQLLTSTDYVSALDSVKILIKIKTHTIENILQTESQEIDLKRGLRLLYNSYGVQIASDFVFEGDSYDYALQFNVKDLIAYVDENDNLTIAYTYVIDNKNVNVTTNIKDESFYANFLMSYQGYGKFNGKGAGRSDGQKNLSASMQFLASARFSYEFVNTNKDYFRITQIQFKHENSIIDKDDYAYYGIELIENENFFFVRFLNDIDVVLQVEPILYFYNISNYENKQPELVEADQDGNYNLSLEFLCEQDGTGKPQHLTLGVNIVSSQLILNSMKIKYYNSNGFAVEPTDVGVYQVVITFNNSSEYSWLSEIELSYKIYLQITKLPITITYSSNFNLSPIVYSEGCSRVDFNQISKFIMFKDMFSGTYFSVNYLTSKIEFENTPNCFVTITNDEFGAQIVYAFVGNKLNLSIVNFKLKNNDFNNNFELHVQQGILAESVENVESQTAQDLLLVEERIEIKPKRLTISGVYVYDKVYDGTNLADYDILDWQFLEKPIDKDTGLIGIDFSKLKFEFEDKLGAVGANKLIKVKTDNALVDRDESKHLAQNYDLVIDDFYKTIYPYSSNVVYVAGVGEISVVNKRGLMDANDEQKTYRQFVNLIPIDAQLDVDVFFNNSNEYREIYASISSYLSNTVVFALGYQIDFVVNNQHVNINKNLYLNLPKVNKLLNALWLDENAAGKLDYAVFDNFVQVDLQQTPTYFKGLALLQAKQFFTWWQISLIILLILIIILLIVLIYIHERRKKKRQDILNEKI